MNPPKPGDTIYYYLDKNNNICLPSSINKVAKYIGTVLCYALHQGREFVCVPTSIGDQMIAITTEKAWQQNQYSYISNLNQYIGTRVYWFHISEIEQLEYIPPPRINPKDDGAQCKNCKEFIPYATSGITCYLCRQDPYRCQSIRGEED